MKSYHFVGGPWHRVSRNFDEPPHSIPVPDPDNEIRTRHGLTTVIKGHYRLVETNTFMGAFYVYSYDLNYVRQLAEFFEEKRPKTCQEQIAKLKQDLKLYNESVWDD